MSYEIEKLERGDIAKSKDRRRSFLAVLLSLAIVLIFSLAAAFHTAGIIEKRYILVYEDGDADSGLEVWVKINKVNTNPKNFAVFATAVKIKNKYDGDIYLHWFNVSVWDTPLKSMFFGSKSIGEISIPGKSTYVTGVNVKIYNYKEFLELDEFYVESYIKWTHYGTTYEKIKADMLDISYWKDLFEF